MCDPVTIGLVGAAVAVGGTAYSYEQGQSAASAAASAQQQAMEAQDEAFNTRMQAEEQQTAAQSRVNQQSAASFDQAQAQQQQDQMSAMEGQQQELSKINDQENAISDQANQAVVNNLPGPGQLQQAQADQQAAQIKLNAPIVQQAATSNPLGKDNTGATASAMQAAQQGASSWVSNYGDAQAALSAYSAPAELAGQEAVNIGTNLMPAAAADQLLKSSAPALLAPYTTAYQNAGQYGAAENTANQQITAGATGLVNTAAGNQESLASLQQGDTDAIVQGNLNLTQQQDAANAALGSGLASLGSLGVNYAANQGALAGIIGGTAKPTAAQVAAMTSNSAP